MKKKCRKKIIHIFSGRGWIRTHGLQNVTSWQTGALATAATPSCRKRGDLTWCNSKTKTKNGRGKKWQALRRALWALKDAQYNYAPCPGWGAKRKFILTKFWDIFQKFTIVEKFKKSKHEFSSKSKKFFVSIFFLNSCENFQMRPQIIG